MPGSLSSVYDDLGFTGILSLPTVTELIFAGLASRRAHLFCQEVAWRTEIYLIMHPGRGYSVPQPLGHLLATKLVAGRQSPTFPRPPHTLCKHVEVQGVPLRAATLCPPQSRRPARCQARRAPSTRSWIGREQRAGKDTVSRRSHLTAWGPRR